MRQEWRPTDWGSRSSSISWHKKRSTQPSRKSSITTGARTKGLFTWTGIFSVGCDSRIRHCTKDRKNPIFCAVADTAVASDTENHGSCKQTLITYLWRLYLVASKCWQYLAPLARNSSQALAAWHSGHCVHLQNRRSRVWIPPGCVVFRNLYIAVLLSLWVLEKK
jgi:hypothetical protein